MHIVTFAAAGGIHGIPILAVEEFTRPVAVTPVPLADRRVAGLMNLRGKSGTVIDLRKCFVKPTGEPSPHGKMILLETTDRLTDEARQLSVQVFREPVVLLVDRICDIFPIRVHEVQPRPAHVPERFVTGVVRHGKDYVSLIDLMILIDDILNPKGTS
jgi:chemotaxis signal transduction protein